MKTIRRWRTGVMAVGAAVLAVSGGPWAAPAEAEVRLQSAGATFPAPLYKRWVAEYQKLHPEVLIDYQSIGSGGGIRSITDKTVHLAGSDAPLGRGEREKIGGDDKVLQLPSCAGGVVPTCNLPGVNADLHFTGAVLADIYLGRITRWNDAAPPQLNPGVALPDLAITPVWRTDGSGTTFIWTNYLATQSPDFLRTIGMGKQVRWPLGQGGKGNEGVTAVVQQTVGGLGYVEQGYAMGNKLAYGAVRNKAGQFVKASPATVSKAGGGAAADMTPDKLTINIWDQPGDEAYPVAAFTYLIVYKDLNNLPSRDHAQALVDFLWWATHDGQQYAAPLHYAPLDEAVRERVEAALKTLTYKGAALKVGS